MEYRIERDSMGEMQVPADRYWAAQTQRSYQNFKIGIEKMPTEIVHAFGILKKGAAIANFNLGKLDEERKNVICQAADDVISGKLMDHFPLAVWQTGSGTQSNMNSNEVIANRGNEIAGKKLLHPNDHINMSQSSNDTFPTALHIAAAMSIEDNLFPAMDKLTETLKRLESENEDVVKSGRTHLQDAVPIRLGQEFKAYSVAILRDLNRMDKAMDEMRTLNMGGTAVGTGLNADESYLRRIVPNLSEISGMDLVQAYDLIDATQNLDSFVAVSGAVKACAVTLSKIANDLRLMSSGPRAGFGEINLPAKQNGSSIMPGKVNPTQCEAMTMVAVQVMGNDAAIGFAASQGNFELNVFMPVIAYNFLQSVRLLSDVIVSFNDNCAVGIKANREKMKHNLHNSLMLVTALNPYIGYDNAAKTSKKAYKENISLKEACVQLGFLTAEKFDEVFHPEEMA